MFRFLERGESRFARDRREPFQKLFQGFSSFEVVEQVLDRHARAPKIAIPPRILGFLTMTLSMEFIPFSSIDHWPPTTEASLVQKRP